MKKRKVDDGVFIKEHLRVEVDKSGKLNQADVVAILEKVTPGITPSDWISKTRAEAERMQAHVDCYPDSDDIAQSAVNLLLKRLTGALDQAENGANESTRLHAAFNAGAHWRELFIRFSSPSVNRGRKVKQGGIKGTETRHGNAKEKEEDRAILRAEVHSFMEEHPFHSPHQVHKIIGEKHNISYKTVARAMTK